MAAVYAPNAIKPICPNEKTPGKAIRQIQGDGQDDKDAEIDNKALPKRLTRELQEGKRSGKNNYGNQPTGSANGDS